MTTLVTAVQLAQLRRMVSELTTAVYSDALLTSYIEARALLDPFGAEPFVYEQLSVASLVDADSAAAQAVLNVAATDGFIVGDTVSINLDGLRAESKIILSIQTGISLTLTTNLAYTHTAVQADAVAVTSRSYQVQVLNGNWTPTFDLNAAAADIWEEKVATLIGTGTQMDFAADGSSFRQSQVADQYKERARYYRSRASSKTMTLHKWPEETTVGEFPWIVNLPEEE